MQKSDYYFGLDIGTDSVGAAATDENYNLLRYKGNDMWFVKLFDESHTAAERRSFRTATRRTQRKRERIVLLQMLFDKAVCEKDEAFFQRLKESNLYSEDKTVGTSYSVFDDADYTDKDFHKEFPTVYHLRKELITNTDVHDVRLIYLAVHHLIKHRGHFLFDIGSSELQIDSFGSIFGDLQNYLLDEYDINLPCDDADKLENILKDRNLNFTRKYTEALNVCGIRRKDSLKEAAILSLLCGKTEKAADIFEEEIDIDNKPLKLQLSGNYDDNASIYEGALGDRFALVEKLKAVYDWTVLANIINGEKYISFAKVKSYDKHKNNLKMLKEYVKEYCPEKYREIFKESRDKLNNYTAYSGMIKQNGKTGVLCYTCDSEAFYNYLKKVFKDLPHDGYENMFAEIDAKTFMPKQHIKENGVIPMQLNRMELEKILDNASTYLDFLKETDERGKTVSEKILDIFDYRIPYYVGPLNKNSDKAWLERTTGKIYPWNFSDIVNLDVSAENFINNLTSKCTYLPTEDVIPKNSVLYCKFTVLNELNNLRINNEKISVELKQSIYNDLFLQRKKVTIKGLLGYLKSRYCISNAEISGIDIDFKSSMRPYLDLSPYGLTEEEMESVIMAITIFGDDKKLLKKRLRLQLGHKLSDDDIGKIGKLNYSGWGRLSEKFLCGIYAPNPNTGELFNLIDALWETNDNLMILLGSKYGFYDSLQKEFTIDTKQSLKEIVNSLYVSPKVKRPIFQSIKMLQEVVKVTGKPPKKIFVEMTRGEGKKGERKESRKEKLIKLYKQCKLDSSELFNQLEGTDNDTLRQDKLYFYYTQFGKCMYTGETINLTSLFDKNIYDIDHIFPRSKVKDDSIDNRVLVKKQVNSRKDNIYPLSKNIQQHMKEHWKFLCDKELISKEKFKRLTRNEPLTDDELSDFISRQLVETSQSTKSVAQILSQLYPESEIVYVKARFVSDFRNNIQKLKCRDVNDLHHAKDAYLNIVVGNVYDVHFTKNKAIFFDKIKTKEYSFNKMFSFNVKGAWISDGDESLNIVKKTMDKNNVIYTRYTFCQHGSLFKINPLKKGTSEKLVPLTKNGPRSSTEKYGGYDKPTATYFTLVRCKGKKGKTSILMQPINLYQVKEFEADPIAFLKNEIGLTEPQILLKRVKYNTCISIDGFRMHISSKSGKSLVYKPAMQLILGYKYEEYVRLISKFINNSDKEKVTTHDKIRCKENLELFDLLVDKMTTTTLKVKFNNMGEKIKEKRQAFIDLPIEKECEVIMQILNILHANVRTGNLENIGLAPKAGVVSTNIDYSSIPGKVQIINQSATGLFENYYNIK